MEPGTGGYLIKYPLNYAFYFSFSGTFGRAYTCDKARLFSAGPAGRITHFVKQMVNFNY